MRPNVAKLMRNGWLQEAADSTDGAVVKNGLSANGPVASFGARVPPENDRPILFCQASRIEAETRSLCPGLARFDPFRQSEFSLHVEPDMANNGSGVVYRDGWLENGLSDLASLLVNAGGDGPLAHCERLGYGALANYGAISWCRPGGGSNGECPVPEPQMSVIGFPAVHYSPALIRRFPLAVEYNYHIPVANSDLTTDNPIPTAAGQDVRIDVQSPTTKLPAGVDPEPYDPLLDTCLWGCWVPSMLNRPGDATVGMGDEIDFDGYLRRRERYWNGTAWAYGDWVYIDDGVNRNLYRQAGDWDWRFFCCVGSRSRKWNSGHYEYDELKYLMVYWDVSGNSLEWPTGLLDGYVKEDAFMAGEITPRAMDVDNGDLWPMCKYGIRAIACVYSVKCSRELAYNSEWNTRVIWDKGNAPFVYVWVCTNLHVKVRQVAPSPA